MKTLAWIEFTLFLVMIALAFVTVDAMNTLQSVGGAYEIISK